MLHKLGFKSWAGSQILVKAKDQDNVHSGLSQSDAASGFRGEALLGSRKELQ